MSDTGTDPEIAAAVRAAERALAGQLAGWATGMKDPAAFAQRFIAAMRAEGWRPPLRPRPEWHPVRRAPPGAPGDEYRALRRRATGHRMVCEPCRAEDHNECRGRTWCDCDHAPTTEGDTPR